MRFRGEILLNGKTATGIEVPAEVVGGLGSNKRPAVAVTLNSYTYRSTIATLGGRFMLPVSAEVRERASVAAGDVVEVNVQLVDRSPRVKPGDSWADDCSQGKPGESYTVIGTLVVGSAPQA